MDLINQFIARYTKEYDYYSQVAQLAQQKLDTNLQTAGIRSMVTARAKSITRLEDKCRQRAESGTAYSTIDDIFDDIVDLAGVRVALYFPAEIDQVDGMIARLFKVLDKKEFPGEPKAQARKKIFSGYSAAHYRVQLKEEDLNEGEKRYAAARIEIQVASVLMHAWSEVEHNLVYKPLMGDLSEEEYALLDQLNGLVLAGEIGLERLQKAGEARVAENDRKIANHYDLAVHLLGAAGKVIDKPISESGLGRVDQLFDLIRALGIDTPGQLKPYIEALHGNVEQRPLAEQIIDTLLAEDSNRYEIYNSIRRQRPWAGKGPDFDNETYRHIGMFMSRWMELEVLLRRNLPPGARPSIPNARQLEGMNLLSGDMVYEFDQLRRTRNALVHGVELPSIDYLDEATERLDMIIAEIKRRLEEQGEGGPPSLQLCFTVGSSPEV